jgi:predicted dienelactone hydrolase
MQRLQTTIWLLAVLQRCGAVSATTLPTTLGPFSPAMLTTQLIDYAHNAPFAPSEDVPRALGISIFYPTAINTTVATSYWPPENAAEESEANFDSGVNTTYDGLLSLTVPLAPPNASIAASPANSSAWPVLLFSPAFGDTRFLYTSLLRQISSNGFVVIAFDTAYDTNVFVLANGTVIQGNRTLALSDSFSQERATTSAEARAQDASFILDHAHDNITSLIPGCNDICMNTTNVGMFGHSIGGAATALAMLADSRIIGGLSKYLYRIASGT